VGTCTAPGCFFVVTARITEWLLQLPHQHDEYWDLLGEAGLSEWEAIVLIGVGLVAIAPIRFFYRRKGAILRFLGGGASGALMGACLSSGTIALLKNSLMQLNFTPPFGMTKSQFITLCVSLLFLVINVVRSIGAPERISRKKGKQ
jgi:hypothetical protein